MLKKIKLVIVIFIFSLFLQAANFAFAADLGLNAVSSGLNDSLTSTDPRILIGRIVQVALGFLGVIAVLIIMYAGFLWMTSEGEEEKVRTAKDLLRNGVIGLIIILSAFGIATFIISRLLGAMDGSSVANVPDIKGFVGSGSGAIGACTIESTYPESNQSDLPRNTSIMVTFKEVLKLESVCVNASRTACSCDNSVNCNKIDPAKIRLYKTDLGDACDVSTCPAENTNADMTVSVAQGTTTLILVPTSPLGSPTENTPYSIEFTRGIKKLDDSSMFKNCSPDKAAWQFTVNNKLDLTPPIVVLGGVFPAPDNLRDTYLVSNSASVAEGNIRIVSCPHYYAAAKVTSVDINGTALPTSSVALINYHGNIDTFKLNIIDPSSTSTAKLFDGDGNSLGVAKFDINGTIVFPNYFSFNSSSHNVGDLWTIKIKTEVMADHLTVNNSNYTFISASSTNNSIQVPAVCSGFSSVFANNVRAILSGQPDINIVPNTAVPNPIVIKAKVAGQAGNDISISSSWVGLNITPMSGGSDRQAAWEINDKKDKPMNSAIQINFNEAINPITVSGSANDVANYIRVVNAATSSVAGDGEECSTDQDCLSYKCFNDHCSGNYLSGKFTLSNVYRTVEFISDKECGMNGCGEKIYCLPANSHLAVELKAASLKTCSNSSECLPLAPFQSCSSTPATCQDPEGHSYPQADLSNLNGIVDAALNSFDGNRNGFSAGQANFYDDNNPSLDSNLGDNYRWSFYVNDQIMIDPPIISVVSPANSAGHITLAEPISVSFNALMLNSTLKTGSTLLNNGSSTTEHKLVNLRSAAKSPLGFWLKSDNQDTQADGEPDITLTKIMHSPYTESVDYKAQVGSGIKDIYQNCYKPSAGPSCSSTSLSPSCCFGSITNHLDPKSGNCP